MDSNASKIALGTVQFGLDYGISNLKGQTPHSEVKKILDLAKKYGIQMIDTASGYGNSEEILGKNGVERFNVVSKFIEVGNALELERQLYETLRKIKSEQLYGYLAHRPDEVFSNLNIWKRLQELKEEGKIIKVGFSFFETTQIDSMLSLNLIPDLVQIPYNVFDKRFEKAACFLREKGVEIHTRSTFLQGLFFKQTKELDPFFTEVMEPINEYQIAYGKNLANYLLKYCLNMEFVDKVVIGINNASQLKKNITGLNCSFENGKVKEPFMISENILNPARWP